MLFTEACRRGFPFTQACRAVELSTPGRLRERRHRRKTIDAPTPRASKCLYALALPLMLISGADVRLYLRFISILAFTAGHYSDIKMAHAASIIIYIGLRALMP